MPRSKEAIILATHNHGKITEFSSLLAPFGVRVMSLKDIPDLPDVDETGISFEENARLKASTIGEKTGFVTIADDSGLEVNYLNGAPGIYSARYSATDLAPATDEKNTLKLLKELSGIPYEKRSARFCCCIVSWAPNGQTIVANGHWNGFIADEPKGENGFGYDPVFFDPEMKKTAAEMTKQEKNERSHRAIATRTLLEKWSNFWDTWLTSV